MISTETQRVKSKMHFLSSIKNACEVYHLGVLTRQSCIQTSLRLHNRLGNSPKFSLERHMPR